MPRLARQKPAAIAHVAGGVELRNMPTSVAQDPVARRPALMDQKQRMRPLAAANDILTAPEADGFAIAGDEIGKRLQQVGIGGHWVILRPPGCSLMAGWSPRRTIPGLHNNHNGSAILPRT